VAQIDISVLMCSYTLSNQSLMLKLSRLFYVIVSDLTIKLNGKEMRGHRFVLAARTDHWGSNDLSQVSVLDLSGYTFNFVVSAKVR